MTKIIVIDTWVNDDCTLGRLTCEDFQCFTLELPWYYNSRNISCIPAGSYLANKYTSPKHGEVLLLKNVKGRSFIEIHAGNFTSQIQGCILVGDGIRDINGDGIPDVTNSRDTLHKLLDLVGDNDVIVQVIRNG